MSGRKRSDGKVTKGSQHERGDIARVACNMCRARKTRCDALRPACSSCTKRKLTCVYDTKDEGETRRMALVRKNEILQQRLARLISLPPGDVQADASYPNDASREVSLPLAGSETQGSSGAQSYTSGMESTLSQTLHDPSDPVQPIFDQFGVPENPRAVMLLDALANKSDQESCMILAGLRLGIRWDVAADAIASPFFESGSWKSWQHILTATTQIMRAEDDPADTNMSNTSSPIISKPTISISSGDQDWLLPSFDRFVWLREIVNFSQLTPEEHVSDHVRVVPGVQNNFANLPFSAHIPGNQFSTAFQDQQTHYMHMPVWSILPISNLSDVRDPFVGVFLNLLESINQGSDPEVLCGHHPYLAALTDEATFVRAPHLSQVVARMVKSIKPEEEDQSITKIGIMWLHWLLWRWLLVRSADSYREMPDMIKPTPWQLFVSHSPVFDFIFSPNLRDHICQTRNSDSRWLTLACLTIACDWIDDSMGSLCPHSITGELDLSPFYKSHVSQPGSWSLGPAVRPFLPSIDKFMRVRPTDDANIPQAFES